MGVVRGVDVTPDKVARRYAEVRPPAQAAGRRLEGRRSDTLHCGETVPAVELLLVLLPCSGHCRRPPPPPKSQRSQSTQVYRLLDDLLAGGFSTLPPAFVHSSATDERLLALPTNAADAARRFKKMFTGGGGKSQFVPSKGEGKGSEDPMPPSVPVTPHRAGRHLSPENCDPLSAVVFEIPPDALPPPPPRAAGGRRPVVAPPPPPRAATPPPAFAGAVDEAEAARPVESEGFGAFGEVKLLEAEKAAAAPAAEAAVGEEGWAQFGEAGLEPMPMPGGRAPPPAPTPPTITAQDVQDSLQLVEVWRAEVAGGCVRSAGVEGRVVRKLAPYGLKSACFRLLPSGAPVVDACLRVAGMDRAFAARVAPPAAPPHFLATFQQAALGCAYLSYVLPAVASAPPLSLSLHTAPGVAPGAGGGWQGLIVLRYAASPVLPGSLLDVVVDLDLPPEATSLDRISPAAQWAKEHARLRWIVPRIAAGASGMLRVVVSARRGVSPEAAAASLARSTLARVRFSLKPGAALSGLRFQVAMPEEQVQAQAQAQQQSQQHDSGTGNSGSDSFLAGRVQCYGEVTVAPA